MNTTNNNILDFMGNTPIVKLQKIIDKFGSEIYVKLEEFNPGGSVKSRIALQMIIDAEKKGLLKPNSNQTIIEPTGGNTGIGLAMVGSIRGYNIILVVPDNYSMEKINILKAYGAEVVLSDSKKGNFSHIEKKDDLMYEHPEYICLNQFINPSNRKTHYENTGREILEALEEVDCFIAGIGTGGTITGVGRKIKEKFPGSIICGVQPVGCDVLKGKAVTHKIQGLSIGILPDVLDKNIVDRVISVEYKEAVHCMKRLAKKEGLLLGISSGANIYAAMKIAKELGEGKKVVTVAPDSGRSYMEVFDENM